MDVYAFNPHDATRPKQPLYPRTQTKDLTIRIWHLTRNGLDYKIVCERKNGTNHWRASELRDGAWWTILRGLDGVAQTMIMQTFDVLLYSKGDRPAIESADWRAPPQFDAADGMEQPPEPFTTTTQPE